MSFDQVVSTTVYLDDASESDVFEKVYRKYFNGALPAQTIVQQIQPAERKPDEEGHYPDLEQVSLIAVRSRPNRFDSTRGLTCDRQFQRAFERYGTKPCALVFSRYTELVAVMYSVP